MHVQEIGLIIRALSGSHYNGSLDILEETILNEQSVSYLIVTKHSYGNILDFHIHYGHTCIQASYGSFLLAFEIYIDHSSPL